MAKWIGRDMAMWWRIGREQGGDPDGIEWSGRREIRWGTRTSLEQPVDEVIAGGGGQVRVVERGPAAAYSPHLEASVEQSYGFSPAAWSGTHTKPSSPLSLPVSFLCPCRVIFSLLSCPWSWPCRRNMSPVPSTTTSTPTGLWRTGGRVPLFQDERGGCAPAMAGIGNTMLSDVPRSDPTCNYAFMPRKQVRVVAVAPGLMDEQPRGVRTSTAAQGFVPVGVMATRAMGSGVASTSGMSGNAAASLSQGLLSHLYDQGMEIDALVRVETKRMRAGLDEAWRWHVRALVAAAERAAAVRLRAAEATLELARCRNAEMEERLRQIGAEGQAWIGVAQSHEVVAAGLRATLDQLLQSPCAGAACDAEDAQSCCFEAPACDNTAA
ncbi:hypothetical protein ACQ4PT_041939 [Festuca glaucescens]